MAFLLPSSAAAQLPELPLPDVPIIEETEAPELEPLPLPGLPGTPPPPSLVPQSDGDSVSGEESGSGSSSAGSGSTSSGSRSTASSRNEGPRTRFDRLPRRYEVLLERILRGENVEASLRRLERALANASPELRARILRLVRRELASLERGGVTPAERRRIERLRRVERMLARRADAGTPAPAATTISSEMTTPPGSALGSPAGGTPEGAVGLAAAGDAAVPKDEGTDVGSGGGALGALGLPDGIALGTALLVLVALLLALGALAFTIAVLPSRALPSGRARLLVRTSRSDFAVIGLVAAAALMLVVLVSALV